MVDNSDDQIVTSDNHLHNSEVVHNSHTKNIITEQDNISEVSGKKISKQMLNDDMSYKKSKFIKGLDIFLNFFNIEKHHARAITLVFYTAFIVSGICYLVTDDARLATVDMYILITYIFWTIVINFAIYRCSNEFHRKLHLVLTGVRHAKKFKDRISYGVLLLIIIVITILFIGILIGIIFLLIFFIKTNAHNQKIIRMVLYAVATVWFLYTFVIMRLRVIKFENKKTSTAKKIMDVLNINQHKEIAKVLNEYKAVIMETDTIMGILSKDLDLIYTIKKRPLHKRIVTFIDDIKEIPKLTNIEKNILRIYWPGGLTIVKDGISYRIPNHPHVRAVLKLTGPVYSSSANISGEEVIKEWHEGIEKFSRYANKCTIVKGQSLSTHPSTIIDFDNKTCLREGIIPSHKIIELLHNVEEHTASNKHKK